VSFLQKSAIFNVCPPVARNTKKALVHCTKPKFSPEKVLVYCTNPKIYSRKKQLFLATRKDMESYSQIPGKRILALEFSIFFGEKAPPDHRLEIRAAGARSF
jgi:hypothetical protein